jgi:membrane protease YdiL (CAAX protease family)
VPARQALLLALGGVFLAALAPLVSWGLWASQGLAHRQAPEGGGAPAGREAGGGAQARWARALLALCLFDTLLALLLVASLGRLREAGTREAPAARPAVRVALGVELEEGVEGGVRVARVRPDSPAARAGLLPGEVVAACDGAPTSSRQALVGCVTAAGAARAVTLRVRGDGGAEREVSARPEPTSLLRGGGDAEGPRSWEPLAGAALLVLLAAAGWVRARAREPVAAAAVLAAVLLLGPPVQGALLPRLPAPWNLLPLGLAGALLLLASRLLPGVLGVPRPALLAATPGWGRALGLALWVHLTLLLRAGLLLGAVLALVGGAAATPLPTPVEGVVAGEVRGALATALFLAVAVVLAPLAEEAFFRGLLLQGLLRWLAPPAAVAASAAVFALMHGGYGPRAALLFVIGCVLGGARLASGGLRVPVLVHAAQNLAATTVMLAMRGG